MFQGKGFECTCCRFENLDVKFERDNIDVNNLGTEQGVKALKGSQGAISLQVSGKGENMVIGSPKGISCLR